MLSLLLALTMLIAVGCVTTNHSDTKYWFSASSANFVPYNEDTDNLSEAGSYWHFTAARDVDVAMNLIINVDNYYSAAYLYVNGEQVRSERDTNLYTYVYKLSLKKGDKIMIHAFWVNSLKVNETGFEIRQISMSVDGSTFLLTEFNKLK